MRIHDLPSRAIGAHCVRHVWRGCPRCRGGPRQRPGCGDNKPTRMKFATQTLNDAQHEYIKVFKREIEKSPRAVSRWASSRRASLAARSASPRGCD